MRKESWLLSTSMFFEALLCRHIHFLVCLEFWAFALLERLPTFDTKKRCESPRPMTDSKMATRTCLVPVTVDIFDTPKRCETPKTMTATKMATLTRLIRVSADTFGIQKRCDSPKTMTDTKMATRTCLIPVTVDTFDTQRRYGRRGVLS